MKGNSKSLTENPGLDSDVRLLKKVAKSHNLSDETYDRIAALLGRRPTVTEVGIFGVMFSEHCSYASSKRYLKTFPQRGKCVLVGAGQENAGLVDIGGGLAVAFKIESHNHPCAVEPHAGAATGVGGILRDIFTMGARPIALLNSLRFGALNGHTRSRFLVDGVVRGISDYGNCTGIPTVGGEIAFDDTYRENPLVNVMCIGVVPVNRIAMARAKGVGNPVVYVGSATGRDGLGGASFASRELTETSDSDRPAVQIGDPFAEKCLIEATLEALATGDVVGVQDMGAAGLTCSTCETASRGGCGIEIDVLRVPRRVEDMSPYEVMLSESQERMLFIVKRGRVKHIKRLFAKWGLNAVVIGKVTSDGRMRVREGSKVVADVPAAAIADEAPIYNRSFKRPRYLDKARRLDIRSIPKPKDNSGLLKRLISSPTIASKACVYERYDYMVQTNTIILPGAADAALVRIKGTNLHVAATTDGNGRYCYLGPYEGAKCAVAEAARNLVCVGARPLAVTNCLNFGNPQDPEIMWQFKECVRGISDACRAFGTPVTGGNVSFYNEGPSGAIDPTPVIGMIGIIDLAQGSRLKAQGRVAHHFISDRQPVTANFKYEGDAVILLGETRDELGASEYLAFIHGRKAGRPPRVDLKKELSLQQVMLKLTGDGLVQSAHDCSDGGLAVALAECCVIDRDRQIGAVIDLSSVTCHMSLRSDALLFGESAGRVIISCAPEHVERILGLARRQGIKACAIGRVGGSRLVIGPWIDVWLEALNKPWRSGLAMALKI